MQFALRDWEEAVCGRGRETPGSAQERSSRLQVPASAPEECEAGPERLGLRSRAGTSHVQGWARDGRTGRDDRRAPPPWACRCVFKFNTKKYITQYLKWVSGHLFEASVCNMLYFWYCLIRAAPRSPNTAHYSQDRSAPRAEAGSEARGPSPCRQQQAKHRLQQRGHLRAQHRCHQQHGDLWRARVRPVPPAQRPHLRLLRPARRPQPRAGSGARRLLHFLIRPRGRQRVGVESQERHVLLLFQRGGPAPTPH